MDTEKLKQKILDLAIRGKLVPQDPNDESAEELIKRIQEEKAKLVKEGKIKASKEESVIFKGSDNCYYEKMGSQTNNITDEIPFEIPSNWFWCRLKHIGEIVGGGTPSTAVKEYWFNGSIVWITPKNMSKLKTNYIIDSDRKITLKGLQNSSTKLMPPDSIIMSSRAPIGYIAINKVPACTSQGCKSVVPYLSNMSEFLLYIIKSSINRIISASSGTTFDEISGTEFSNILIPLAPINEQIRIVKQIDETLKLLRNISEEYKSIQELVTVTKSKILDSFFSENSSYKSYYENKIPITDDVEILDFLRKPINTSERLERLSKTNNTYPYYGATGQTGLIDDYLIDGEYVLLGEDGAPFLDKSSPKAYIINGKSWVNNHVHILKSKTNNKFLMYYLNWFDYYNYVTGTTRLKLNQAMLKKILIPNIPIEIKEKIVSHIDATFYILESII